jgi:hypothetical protein
MAELSVSLALVAVAAQNIHVLLRQLNRAWGDPDTANLEKKPVVGFMDVSICSTAADQLRQYM